METNKNKRGRPPKRRKLAYISFRAYPDDFLLLQEAQIRLSLPKSMLMRYVFNNSLFLDYFRSKPKIDDPFDLVVSSKLNKINIQ